MLYWLLGLKYQWNFRQFSVILARKGESGELLVTQLAAWALRWFGEGSGDSLSAE